MVRGASTSDELTDWLYGMRGGGRPAERPCFQLGGCHQIMHCSLNQEGVQRVEEAGFQAGEFNCKINLVRSMTMHSEILHTLKYLRRGPAGSSCSCSQARNGRAAPDHYSSPSPGQGAVNTLQVLFSLPRRKAGRLAQLWIPWKSQPTARAPMRQQESVGVPEKLGIPDGDGEAQEEGLGTAP